MWTRRRLPALLAMIAIVSTGYQLQPWSKLPARAVSVSAGTADQSQGSRARTSNQAVPVLAVAAESADVPIILRGIGTVQAFNTVALRSRVGGNVVRINFEEGQVVHVGDVLVEIDPRPFQAALDQAKATLAKDQALLTNARADLARAAALFEKKVNTDQQYKTQQTTVLQDEAMVESDKAQVQTAALNLEFATIRSPIEGITGIRQVDIGNLITANTGPVLVVVTQLKPTYVVFTLPERDITRIRAAMAKGSVPVQAFDAEDGRMIAQGVLNLVDNAVDQTTGTVRLKAQFANEDTALWPGQFVNAHLVVDVVRQGVTIPAAAVQAGTNGPFAYVVRPDTTVDARPITTIQTDNNRVLIGSGLEAGDKVVVAGQFRLEPGVRVAIKTGALPPLAELPPSTAPPEVPRQ